MRRYIPFSAAAGASASEPARSPSPSSRPHTPIQQQAEPATSHAASSTPSEHARPHSPPSRSHLPHVSLPHVPHVSVPHVPALPSVRKFFHTNSSNDSQAAPASTALNELSGNVEQCFGPVGNPNPKYAALSDDCLFIELSESVHSRRRVLTQFLRARQGNAHEAFIMMLNTFKWRKATNMHLFISQSAVNMLRPNACFPMHIISDPETCKQPVAYGLPRLLDKRRVDRTDFHNALLSFLESIYFAHTYVLDEIIIILDFRDWSIRRNAPYRLVKDGIQILQEFYPDRLGYVFLVNYPVTIRAAYTVISPIIDPGAKEKIVWAAEDDPAATLSKYVAPKCIPTFIGGELETVFPAAWPDVASEFECNR